jgi:hypothetical protein
MGKRFDLGGCVRRVTSNFEFVVAVAIARCPWFIEHLADSFHEAFRLVGLGHEGARRRSQAAPWCFPWYGRTKV